MLYQQPTFTLPSAPNHVSEKKWDFSILNKEEFIEKYDLTEQEYYEYAVQALRANRTGEQTHAPCIHDPANLLMTCPSCT